MDYKKLTIDDSLKIAIIAGVLMVALSFAYYLAIRPIQKDARYESCLKNNRYPVQECIALFK
jgi:uncharacterized membrane protein YfhO